MCVGQHRYLFPSVAALKDLMTSGCRHRGHNEGEGRIENGGCPMRQTGTKANWTSMVEDVNSTSHAILRPVVSRSKGTWTEVIVC